MSEIRSKHVREGDEPPKPAKAKRQVRRQSRRSDKQELEQFLGCGVTKMGQIVLLFGKER